MPAEHNHARTVAIIFFNWCLERRYITDNPVIGIAPYERKRRSRILTDAELKKIWGACDSEEPLEHFRTIVRLLILLGQRETETATLDQLCDVTGWTLHDIRRTFRTNLGRLGVAPHIAERLVNHISARTDMERTYDIYSYLPEMRAAIEKWEGYLLKLLATKKLPNNTRAA